MYQAEDPAASSSEEEVEGMTTPTEKNAVVTASSGSADEKGPASSYRTDPADFDDWRERYAASIATRPCCHFWIALLISIAVGTIGIVVGDFAVEVDNDGWYSRGTLIANRHQQFWLVDYRRYDLFTDETGAIWEDLETNTQELTTSLDVTGNEEDQDRRLSVQESTKKPSSADWQSWGSRFQATLQFFANSRRSPSGDMGRSVPKPQTQDWLLRRLQDMDDASLGPLQSCNLDWYNSSALFDQSRLWPVYKNKQSSKVSLWDGPALEEMCEFEQVTLQYLQDNGLCFGCQGEDEEQQQSPRCLLPYSPVLLARMTIPQGLTLTCAELAQTWAASYQTDVESDVIPCVESIKTDYNPYQDGADLPDRCPAWFFPNMLDESFGTESGGTTVMLSSAIYPTRESDIDAMYEAVDNFGYGREYMETFYDTQNEDFVIIATDEQVLIDMALAVGSAVITFLAMNIHTRSPFLASVGLLQIVLSFPVAFFIYTFIAQLVFFPFLNFIGVFVLFALGADDVFVAVDKWKNARLARPDAPVQEIAAKAFPDAAVAMLLTTLTTAVAFFGTAVCSVAPILCFAVFVGLLVVADYILCCVLVFPALVLYDNRLRSDKPAGCCYQCSLRSCCCCFVKVKGDHADGDENVDNEADQDPSELSNQRSKEHAEHMPSLIHRILDRYYKFLHRFRWVLLLICGGALIASSITAAQITLPNSADVRLFDEEDNQYEANYIQRQNLLFDVIERQVGSTADVIWGVTPADSGTHNDPTSWTKLVLDPSFDPSQEDVQTFLRDYCDKFFDQEFASRVSTDYQCPMTRLNDWLVEQAASETPESIYAQNCAGSSEVPIPQASFDACAYSWSQAYGVDSMLAKAGKVTIISIPFSSRVRYDSPQDDLRDEWNTINTWMNQNMGPEGAGRPYFTSEDFWWYDTNAEMLKTAYTSAGIAMGAAATVILFSSRSFVLTLFATVTVGYVLTSVTAVLVAMGWTLGFIESILFAILIGISCDFVIHFSHAYASLQGQAPCNERTRFALQSMGPSILAAAFTTFAAALVMLFTVVTFFEKFAIILFLTIAQATVGSFLVFLVTVDCIGPSDPTNLMDRILTRCFGWCGKDYHVQGLDETEHFTTKEFNNLDG